MCQIDDGQSDKDECGATEREQRHLPPLPSRAKVPRVIGRPPADGPTWLGRPVARAVVRRDPFR